MLTLGITGVPASGKSYLSAKIKNHFKSIGLFDCDKAVSALYESHKGFKFLLEQRFGTSDKKKLGEVFNEHDPVECKKKLNIMESISVPFVFELFSHLYMEALDEGCELYVIDAPLLHEYGFARFCDINVLTTVSKEQLLNNLSQRNWTYEDWNNRMKHQYTQEQKRQFSDIIVDTQEKSSIIKLIDLINTQIN